VLNFNSLDLANNIVKKQEQYIIEQTSSSTTTVVIKDIGTGLTFPRVVNRHLATYGKINKNYILNLKEDELNANINNFLRYKAMRIAKVEEALKQKKISKDQFLVFVKRFNAIDLSYVHATISDIIEESVEDGEEYVTIIYHVITTKPTIIDHGGPNQFKPIYLYHNKEADIVYYTIPLTYIQKLKKKDYIMFYVLKSKEAFKNDTDEVQNNLAYNIKKVSEITTFQMLDVNEKCLKDIPFNEIIPDEAFPISIYSKDITCYVPSIPYLFD
jgi:hypothetical protein